MVGVLIAPELIDGQDEHQWRELYQFYGLLTGQQDWGAYVTLIAGATINGLIVTGDLRVTGNTLLDGNVDLGNASSDVVTINGTATAQANLTVKGAFTADGASEFNATAQFDAQATFNAHILGNATMTVNGNVTLGDAPSSDAVKINAGTIVQGPHFRVWNTVGSGTAMFVDTGSLRTILGLSTAPANVANDMLDVVGGRSYLMANSENYALGLRYSQGAGTFFLGASNVAANPDLILSAQGGNQVGRWLAGGALIVGAATAPSGSELLRVQGAVRVEGTILGTNGALFLTNCGNSYCIAASSVLTASSATAGGGSAPPATPALYFYVQINGSNYRVAAYN